MDPSPTPFMASLTDAEVDRALTATRASVEERRAQVAQLSADLTRLTRELLALEQDQLRRRRTAAARAT